MNFKQQAVRQHYVVLFKEQEKQERVEEILLL